jgi:uncharacterized protein
MDKSKESPMPNSTPDGPTRRPAPRGFAAMDAERRREIARKGGKSVPDEKRSFTQDRTLAAEAGRKGGRQTQSGRNRDGGGSA